MIKHMIMYSPRGPISLDPIANRIGDTAHVRTVGSGGWEWGRGGGGGGGSKINTIKNYRSK
jgi:hypothetical protein